MRQRPGRQWSSRLLAFPGGFHMGDPIGDAVNVYSPAPSTISVAYSPSTIVLAIGVPMAAATPTVVGVAPRYWLVRPALPAGLELNNGTGVISGTPTVLQGSVAYTVTALSGDDPRYAAITISVV